MKSLFPIEIEPLSQGDFTALATLPSSLTLGTPQDADCFWMVLLEPPLDVCRILIAHSNYHLRPGVYGLGQDSVLVGVLEQLFLVKCCEIKKCLNLPCRFYEVIYDDANRFIVMHEIGFTCLTFELEALWEWSGDLVDRWDIRSGQLFFETFSGEQKKIDIHAATGRELGSRRGGLSGILHYMHAWFRKILG